MLSKGKDRLLSLPLELADTHSPFQLNLQVLAWIRPTHTKGDQMARFVLVHGAFSGAWIWGPLIDRLKAAGHSVETFDLPGLGEDQTPASEVSLDACADRLCETLTSSS